MRVRCLIVFAFVACSSGPRVSNDLRFQSPKATIDTLLETYGLEGVTQDEVRRRMRVGRTFHLNDPATRDLCFADLGHESDEGFIGFVFGSVAAGKDDLRITVTDDVAHVFSETREGRRARPVVLRQDDEGAWKIILNESVPDSVRTRLSNARTTKIERMDGDPSEP